MESVASIILRNQFNRPSGSRIRNYGVAQMQTGIEAVKDYFCHLSFQDFFMLETLSGISSQMRLEGYWHCKDLY